MDRDLFRVETLGGPRNTILRATIPLWESGNVAQSFCTINHYTDTALCIVNILPVMTVVTSQAHLTVCRSR